MIKEQYAEAQSKLQEQMSGYQLVPMEINDITYTKDGKTGYFKKGNHRLSGDAIHDMANLLGLKESTTTKIKQEDSWTELAEVLGNIQGKVTTVAMVDERNSGIVSFYDRKDVKIPTPVTFAKPLSLIESYIESVEGDLRLGKYWFDPRLMEVGFHFRDPSIKIDTLKDNKDIWNPGIGMTFDLNQFRVGQFFTRLVCTNGMTTEEETSRVYIGNKDLTQYRFNKVVNGYIGSGDSFNEVVQERVDRMINCTASVHELKRARAVVKNGFDERIANKFLSEHFPMLEVEKAYARLGVDAEKLPADVARMANTNINAYDFFNSCTYIGTHETGATGAAIAHKLNAIASEMFFRGPSRSLMVGDPFLN